jgi:hypothetical protein
VTYNPKTGRVIRRHINVEDGESLVRVACPSRTQCTAIDNDGTMLTFSPLTGRRYAAAKIDPAVGLDAPSGDSNDELDGIACPSIRRCVAVDTLGNAVVFNPTSRRSLKAKLIDPGESLSAVACPGEGECVAVDSGGRALVGDPRGNRWTVDRIATASTLLAVACVSQNECVAVDDAGNAYRSFKP